MVSHCDDDVLSLLALGESVGQSDHLHVASCMRCQSRLDQLSAVVGTARSVTPADHLVGPPDSVWSAVRAELGLAAGTPTGTAAARRRSRAWVIAATAAVFGAIIGGGVVAGFVARQPTESVVARAALAQMDDSGLAGTATIRAGEGGDTLTVSVPGLKPVDGYYEVWMATADASTMVSIGTLVPGLQETFYLPAGINVSAFPVVDVSIEHLDGDAAHSAQSVVRGQLTT